MLSGQGGGLDVHIVIPGFGGGRGCIAMEMEDVGRGTGVEGVLSMVRLREMLIWLWYLMLERMGRGRGEEDEG